MASKRRKAREPKLVQIGFKVPDGYTLLACCASCRHYVEVKPPEDDYESDDSPACNIDRNLPDDPDDMWWPWSINHEVAKHGWCPSYQARQLGEKIERRKEEENDE
jgi:hypothetical protein